MHAFLPVSRTRVLLAAGLIAATLFSAGQKANAQATAPNQWTWIGGSNTGASGGVYGTLGTPAAGNVPGGRYAAVSWTDKSGNFWLFGGCGINATGTAYLNDLWEYSPATKEWAWISGSSDLGNGYAGCAHGSAGVYGALNTPAAGNSPGSRYFASGWNDSSGNLWLYGGWGYDINGSVGLLNDLWEFNPSTKQWAWMGGSSTLPDNTGYGGQPAVYGSLLTPAIGNNPGGRSNAAYWTDKSGNFWLFSGYGNGNKFHNDLWEFNPSTGEWAWMGGSDTTGSVGVYGTLGTPDPGNVPGARIAAASTTDSNGNFWLFGGSGYIPTNNGNYGDLNDLWEFNPSTTEWTWMGGGDTIGGNGGNPGVYGTLGTPAAGNVPGSRDNASIWTDSSGNLWLFAGTGWDENNLFGRRGDLNDLWEFNPSTKLWTWMGGTDSILGSCYAYLSYEFCGAPGVYGTLGTPAAGNIPPGRNGASSWTDSLGNLWLFGGDNYLNDLWVYQPSSTPSFTAAATPVISLAAGTYTTVQSVTITDATPGAAIYYTTDNSTPTSNATPYTGAIGVSSTETIRAIAVASGYFNSAIASAAYTINLPPPPQPDFSISLSPSTWTLAAGQFVGIMVTVAPQTGFHSKVSFSCSAGVSCTFSPQTVTPGTSLVNWTTMTVTTTATTASLQRTSSPVFPGSMLAAALCCIGWKRRRRLQMLLLLVVSVVGLGLLSGCGGGSSTPPIKPTQLTVTVTGTSGSLSRTANLALTVYPTL